MPRGRNRGLMQVNATQLERIGLAKDKDPPGVIGFRNHFTAVRGALCRKCRNIVCISGHLLPHTPVPEECECRDRVPPGEVAEFVFRPDSTPGIDYSDLVFNGGLLWGYGDWDLLVFIPLRKASDSDRYDLLLPCVAMLQYLCNRDLEIPYSVMTILRERLNLRNSFEILRFIRFGLVDASRYITNQMNGPFMGDLMHYIADDCWNRLNRYCTADVRVNVANEARAALALNNL